MMIWIVESNYRCRSTLCNPYKLRRIVIPALRCMLPWSLKYESWLHRVFGIPVQHLQGQTCTFVVLLVPQYNCKKNCITFLDFFFFLYMYCLMYNPNTVSNNIFVNLTVSKYSQIRFRNELNKWMPVNAFVWICIPESSCSSQTKSLGPGNVKDCFFETVSIRIRDKVMSLMDVIPSYISCILMSSCVTRLQAFWTGR